MFGAVVHGDGVLGAIIRGGLNVRTPIVVTPMLDINRSRCKMMLLDDRGTCANNLPEITRLCVYRSDWNWKREKPSLYYCLRSERCFWVATNGRDDLSFKMFLFDFAK